MRKMTMTAAAAAATATMHLPGKNRIYVWHTQRERAANIYFASRYTHHKPSNKYIHKASDDEKRAKIEDKKKSHATTK